MKHQLYRTSDGKEIILEGIAGRELDNEGKPTGKVTKWIVCRVEGTYFEGKRLGLPFEVEAKDFSWMGRTINIPDPHEKRAA